LNIRWTKIALSDLESFFEYIASEDRLETARTVIKKIIAGVDNISKFPDIGHKGRVPKTKELVIPGTPFTVVYRVHKNALQILTIIHHSRMW
jgi:addiction module RelE/StbE family toxin